jgi:hypothetical protein
MIRFGLRLTFRGGREAAVRLIITAVAWRWESACC